MRQSIRDIITGRSSLKVLSISNAIAILLLVQVSWSTQSSAHQGTEPSGVKIVVIGATARTADDLIPQALWRGHEVVAFARRPYRIRHTDHPRLTKLKGDVYDLASIEAALSGDGKEIVISLVGPRVDPTVAIPETDLLSQGTTNIIAAMKSKGNKRLFVSGSMAAPRVWRLGYEADTPQPANITPENGLWAYNLRGPYNDMRNMEEITRKSGLDYIILRPGSLVVEPPRGTARVTVSEDEVPSKRVVMYSDFAAWILDQLESDEFLFKTVSIFSDTLRSELPTQSFESSIEGLRKMKEEAEADLARDAQAN
jgi:putative NADH-flavin reductase